ncbi:DUF814 domain protein [Aspergillus luchuensis]|uniref:DUF814 domain protein n=1 Tax=Aspergillus kawachii TaxID=1069201 RepID=A0A146FPT0_ASPKA|nr:DUF814 domain protein [Aspergillus luchuensis]
MNSRPDTPAESGDICVDAKSIFDDWYLIPVGTLKKKGDKSKMPVHGEFWQTNTSVLLYNSSLCLQGIAMLQLWEHVR